MTPRRVLFVPLDAEISGGNIVCAQLAAAAVGRGIQPWMLLPRPGPLLDRIAPETRVVYLDLCRMTSLHNALRLARLLRRERISLVNTHTMVPGMLLTRVAVLLTGLPVVHHVHGRVVYTSRPGLRQVQQRFARYSARATAPRWIAVSHSVRAELVAGATPAERISVVHNGVREHSVTASAASLRHGEGIAHAATVFLHVGRLEPNKGQLLFVKAAAMLVQDGHDAVFLIAGADAAPTAPYRRQIEEEARRSGLAGRVRLLGERSNVPELLELADALVLPSLREGLPLVVLEAMAAGKPVIATRVGGIPEAVQHEVTGILVEPDMRILAAAMARVVCNPNEARALGEAGRNRARECFSHEAETNAVFAVIEAELMRPSPKGRQLRPQAASGAQ